MKHDEGDLVRVDWTDAAYALDDIPPLQPMVTVGYLVVHDDERVVVANEYYAGEEERVYRGFTAVPLVLVDGIETLETA